MEAAKLIELCAKLNVEFKDFQFLESALTHASAAGATIPKTNGCGGHYERLEYLGDAVLDLVVADLLSRAYPEASEGELTKMRAALVNTENLAELGKQLNLGDYVQLSQAARAQGGIERPALLADVVEALIGAIYRDSGFDAAYRFIAQNFTGSITSIDIHDPKTMLQELLHKLSKGSPQYELEKVDGPEHAPRFISHVKVGGEVCGRGEGNTKKLSQRNAAAEALKKLTP
jgi:ribonuclease-3